MVNTSNTNHRANPQIKQLIANKNQLMQAILQTLQHLQPNQQQQLEQQLAP
jgi:HPt (histidine-containing phosphotransfer) domain-containing protein